MSASARQGGTSPIKQRHKDGNKVNAAEDRVWLTTARLDQCGNEIVECIARDLNAAETVSRQLYSTQQTPSQAPHLHSTATSPPEAVQLCFETHGDDFWPWQGFHTAT